MKGLDQRTPGITGLDHAVIAVRDLDAARETFARMGFTLAPRGAHSTGSSNHNIMLGRDYVELLHVPNANPLQAYFHAFLARHEGLAALALTGADVAAAIPVLAGRGFEPSAPRDFSRAVTAGSRTGTARFRLVNIASHATPGAQVFICEHFTRELVWLPELQRHANGATGIAAVAFVADNVAYLAGVYGRVFGAWPARIDEGLLVATGAAPLAFCTRAALQQRLRDVVLPDRPAPHAAALFIRVADRAQAHQALRDGGFAPRRMNDGSWAIDAPDAHGVALVFG
ncbi:MAG: VOC family protein [Burkholderiales bacterium]|nr:VOC family protein [Burkholderiales bacterium]